MIIIHKNPTEEKRTARAPYNFVQLPYDIVKVEQPASHDKYDQSRHTGYIDCAITTESPLYVRCAVNSCFYKKYADKECIEFDDYDEYSKFFSTYDSEIPVIPGSSIRGMIRTLVEIASFSTMNEVANKKLAYRAVAESTSIGTYYKENIKGQKAGYIVKKDNQWFIIPAEKITEDYDFVKINENYIPNHLTIYHNQEHTYITTDKEEKKCGLYNIYIDVKSIKDGMVKLVSPTFKDGYKEALLIITGDVKGKKKHCIFGLPKKILNESDFVEIPDSISEDYESQISKWQEDNIGKKGVLQFEYKYPVFYITGEKDGRKIASSFGHTLMFRLVYKDSPSDHVPENIKGDNVEDMAGVLFGYAATGKDIGKAGRLSFADAVLSPGQSDIWLSDTIPKPILLNSLSEPKPTAFQHYLTQQYPDYSKKLNHYDNPREQKDKETTSIRGHKLYWHKGNVDLAYINELNGRNIDKDKTNSKSNAKQKTKIRPVKSGVRFTSRIYFENLNDAELGALLWVLKLPSDCRHSLGMYKPYGLGAVKIEPTLHMGNRTERYKRLFDGDKWFESYHTEENIKKYKDCFEELMLSKSSEKDKRDAGKFTDLTRIKMLLEMLKWPGPDKKLTEYMRIGVNHEKNEFKDRPVLPDPFHIKVVDKQISTYKDQNKGQNRRYDNKKKERNIRNTANHSDNKYKEQKPFNSEMFDALKQIKQKEDK